MAKKKQTVVVKEHELDTTELSSPPEDTCKHGNTLTSECSDCNHSEYYSNLGKLPALEKKDSEEKKDSDYWGEKMVKLQDRVNELELSLSHIDNKLKKVAGRLGI